MSFTTLAFALFLLIVFCVYWLPFAKSYKMQNAWLLLAGYVFYGWWDWRFIGLILTTTLISWGCALPRKNRKTLTGISIAVNLLILCVFKYYNFFGESLQRLFNTFGGMMDWFTIDILLPVGISFYTFQAISYSVDTYKGKISPTRNFITYAVYIAFFPQLVAGPIEKSTELLPQFERKRKWNYAEAVLGMRQILWGLFKKCVIADGVSFWVNQAFDETVDKNIYFLKIVGAVGFALQIYGDFSGYSDIAKGSARLFGIKLMDNFLYPFFSRNALELWHRWHRSLMQWFTEYVYIPLGGSRSGNLLINVMIVFVLSGIWHGANFTFILWGTLCGIWYIIALKAGAKKYRPRKNETATRADLHKIAFTFVLFIIVFVSFRANNLSGAFNYYKALVFPGLPIFLIFIGVCWLIKLIKIKFKTLVTGMLITGFVLGCIFPKVIISYLLGFSAFVYAAVMLCAEWKSRNRSFALEKMPQNRLVRLGIYSLLYIIIYCFAIDSRESSFIYFQF